MKDNKQRDKYKLLFNVINIVIFTITLFVMIFMYYEKQLDYTWRGYLTIFVAYCFVIIVFGDIFEIFNIGGIRIIDLVISMGITLFFTNIVTYFIFSLAAGKLVIRTPFYKLIIIQSIMCVVMAKYESKYVRKVTNPLDVLVIHNGKHNNEIKKLEKYQKFEINIKKVVNCQKNNLSQIIKLIDKYDSVITLDLDHNYKKKIAKVCYEKNKSIYDLPSITDILIQSSRMTNFIDTPLFMMNKFGPNSFEKIVKRIVDVCGSLVLIIMTSPIMLAAGLIIKLQDGGSAFYRQKRYTTNGEVFELVKFRSMIMNAEPNGKPIKTKKNDNRLTPFGKFIRATRIDELPQLFNIFRGDMSFVGPRALRIEEYKENEKIFPEFKYRLKVKAGLTGYAQVYGKYNTSYRDKLLLDVYYIENYSLISDLKLLLMTVKVVFKKDSTEGF